MISTGCARPPGMLCLPAITRWESQRNFTCGSPALPTMRRWFHMRVARATHNEALALLVESFRGPILISLEEARATAHEMGRWRPESTSSLSRLCTSGTRRMPPASCATTWIAPLSASGSDRRVAWLEPPADEDINQRVVATRMNEQGGHTVGRTQSVDQPAPGRRPDRLYRRAG